MNDGIDLLRLQAARAVDVEQRLLEKTRKQENAIWWARNWTETYDQEWSLKGLEGPYHGFPDLKYLDYLFDFITESPKLIKVSNKKVRLVPKSRKTLVSWACVAKLVHRAQTLAEQEIVFQSQAQKKGNYLIKYAKTLYDRQPEWMKAAFPLSQRLEEFAMDQIEWKNGSKIVSIPEGSDQIRTMHPSVVFMDEAAFQPEGEGAYDATLAAAGLIVLVSSPAPGWFQELVEEPELPDEATVLSPGLFFTETSRGIPVLWIRHDAIPERDEKWEKEERGNYKVESSWLREQKLNFLAGGGERIFYELLNRRWDEIIITNPKEIPWEELNYGAGLDYGKTHFGTWIVSGIDRSGVKYSLLEHGCRHLTPHAHFEMMKQRKLDYEEDGSRPLALAKCQKSYYDPSLDTEDVVKANAFTSNIKLFAEAGMRGLRKANRGQDQLLVNYIEEAWNQTPVKYRIYCPNTVRKRENTHAGWKGCPNLLWELMHLRRKENSLIRQMAVGESEEVVDKDNDFWDALKYWWTSNPAIPVESVKEKWQKKAQELKEANPQMDLNSLIIYAKKFDDQNKPKEPSWR